MGQGSVGRIALCVVILTAGSARAARPPQIKSLDDDSAVQLSVLMQEEPSAANDCGMLPNVDKDCTPCEGDTPYVDLVIRECVAECTVGHEIKGGDEPDKGQCVACQAGKFADHVKHTCGSACPEGTTENDHARNCDSHVTLYKDTDVTLSEEGSTSDSSEEERKKRMKKRKKKKKKTKKKKKKGKSPAARRRKASASRGRGRGKKSSELREKLRAQRRALVRRRKAKAWACWGRPECRLD